MTFPRLLALSGFRARGGSQSRYRVRARPRIRTGTRIFRQGKYRQWTASRPRWHTPTPAHGPCWGGDRHTLRPCSQILLDQAYTQPAPVPGMESLPELGASPARTKRRPIPGPGGSGSSRLSLVDLRENKLLRVRPLRSATPFVARATNRLHVERAPVIAVVVLHGYSIAIGARVLAGFQIRNQAAANGEPHRVVRPALPEALRITRLGPPGVIAAPRSDRAKSGFALALAFDLATRLTTRRVMRLGHIAAKRPLIRSFAEKCFVARLAAPAAMIALRRATPSARPGHVSLHAASDSESEFAPNTPGRISYFNLKACRSGIGASSFHR